MSTAKRRKAEDPVARENVQTLLYQSETDGQAEAGKGRITILPPQDVFETLAQVREPVMTTILDPWYNKGVGGTKPD